MTNDCSRIFNILSDWAHLEGQGGWADEVFSTRTVRHVLNAANCHAQRLSFALSLLLGIEPSECAKALSAPEEIARLESILERCRRKEGRIKIS
ncbi:hypothetical protein RBE51_19120 [Pseudomonas taiwanensis]|uniref:hypothetical protein n=1 Tax=Pseudomonas taiwanensis TaxID=470150 RepID=UPI0028DFDD5F|nr:hypothetical protein [Pseudomonas taiwanensis]MDT8924902.1 hypothetical protein [Pseudomonas taiwanensis]